MLRSLDPKGLVVFILVAALSATACPGAAPEVGGEGAASHPETDLDAPADAPSLGTAKVATGAEIVAAARAHPRLMVEGHFDRLRSLHAGGRFTSAYGALASRAAELVAKDAAGAFVVPLLRRADNSLLALGRELQDRVYSLLITHAITPDPRYVDRAWRELANVCNPTLFPTWREGSDDLQLAEFSHAVAIGYDWLYAELSPERRAHLRRNLVERVLTEARATYAAGRWWDVPVKLSNWNLVVNGGVILAALAVAADGDASQTAESTAVLDLALASLRRGLPYFDAQGGTPEGPGYWIYATEYLNLAVESLVTATGSAQGLLDPSGVRSTPEFVIQVRSNRGRAFNFADSSGIGTPPAMHWLGWRVGRPLYRYFARKPYLGRRLSIAYFLLNYRDEGSDSALASLARVKRFAGVEVGAMRGSWTDLDTPWLAFKGGDNQASHAHLDLGSFVFEAGGVDWFVDPGLDSYALPGYFSNRESEASLAYDYYRIRTEGQNAFVLNPGEGPEQRVTAKAPMSRFSAAGQFAVVDLSQAYDRHVTAARRGFLLLPSGAVVRDELDGAKASTQYLWMAHVRSSVSARVLPGGTAVVLTAQNGTRLLVAVRGAGLTFRVGADGSPLLPAVPLPTSPNPPGQASNEAFRKLVIVGATTGALRASVVFHRLAEGEAEILPADLDGRVERDVATW
jgi:hypothetical protein